MQKLDQSPTHVAFPGFTVTAPADRPTTGLNTAQRLLVIVLDADTDTPLTAQRIMDAANSLHCPILFLGLCAEKTQELELRRSFITLSTVVGEAGLPVDSKIEVGRDWLKAVETHWQAGDMLLVVGGQAAGMRQRLLDQLHRSQLPAVIYSINEPTALEETRPHWKTTVLAWTGFTGIILGFFWLQVRIDRAFSDWAGMVLLILSIFAEFLAIWFWNNLLG